MYRSPGPLSGSFHPAARRANRRDSGVWSSRAFAWRDAELNRHDSAYGDWRRTQAQSYDTTYREWRKARQDKFASEFTDWRTTQTNQTTSDAPKLDTVSPKTNTTK